MSKIQTMDWLMNQSLKAEEWVVEQFLSPGAIFLYADERTGKSLFMLGLSFDITYGRNTIGNRKTSQGNVLYLSFEDDIRMLQNRTKAMKEESNSFFHIYTDWPRMGEGGLERLENWSNFVRKPRIIIIDVLSDFRSEREEKKALYDSEKQMVSQIDHFAKKHNLCVVLVHHTTKSVNLKKKSDSFSGSRGLIAGATGGIEMENNGENYCEFRIEHKSIQKFSFRAKFNSQKMRYEELIGVNKDKLPYKQKIFYEVVEEGGSDGCTLTEIIAMIRESGEFERSINMSSARNTLSQMIDKKLISRSNTNSKKYVITDLLLGSDYERVIEHHLDKNITQQELDDERNYFIANDEF